MTTTEPTPEPADIRDRVARAMAHEDAHNAGYDHGFAASYGGDPETDGFVDAVLAVLPAPADRAAVLREVEQAVRIVASNCAYDSAAGCEFCNGVDAALEQIRRLADGAQQPEAEAHVWATVPASDAYGRLVGHTWTRCTICGQTQQTTTDQPDAEPEAQQPEAEVRPQRVQCGDCGAVGPVITEGGLAYLDPSGQIGHHAQPGTGGVCVFGTGRPQAEGAQR